MKSLYILYFLSVLCGFFVGSVCQQYPWNCTALNENGQRYIPSDRDRDAYTSTTDGNQLYVYSFSNLDANCYGPVTAIEYCYRYSPSAETGQPTFNWTVLILEDAGSNFVINKTYFIQSYGSLDNATCTSSRNYVICCDITSIESFDLPKIFIFGVTESAEGNTHNAALLGFHDSLPQFRVGTLILSKAVLNLSVGSSVPRSSLFSRGVRMLWFVIGFANTEQLSTTMSTSVETSDISTQFLTAEEFSVSKTIGIPITGKQENETTIVTLVSIASNPGVSVALIGAVIGGVVGSLLVLALLLLLLALVWMTKKYKRAANLLHQQKQSKVNEQREATQQHQQCQQRQGDEVLESNDAYISTTQRIPTQDNVAYGQATPQITTEDNVAYGQRECDNNLLSDQYEYDYI